MFLGVAFWLSFSPRAQQETTADLWGPILPNLKLVTRDRAHAARRITLRPWKSDSRIKEVLDKVIFMKGSIVNKIKNSDFFKVWHQRNIGKVSKKIINSDRSAQLGYSKQRFDSTQRPLGRCVLEFEALIMTAQQIAEARKGTAEGEQACGFLEYINTERMLILAMGADAGDEVYEFVLQLDKEDVENELLNRRCNEFLERIALLFGPERQCFNLGYTQHMLNTLQRQRVIYTKGEPRSFGGASSITQAIKDKVIGIYWEWCNLARLVVRAEFPSFEIVYKLAIFDLNEGQVRPVHEQRADDYLNSLAKYLEVSEEALRDEFYRVLPVAKQKMLHTSGISNAGAWQQAVWHLAQRDKTKFPVIRSVLRRLLVFTNSSCGVEKAFSKAGLRC